VQVLPFTIPKPRNERIIHQIDDEPFFYGELHRHDEIQLSHIVKGEGQLIVGDKIERYEKGDVFLIGSKTPHVFRSDSNSDRSLMHTLFFHETLFPFEFQEEASFKLVLQNCQPGFACKISGPENLKVLLAKIPTSNIDAFNQLFNIAQELDGSTLEALSSELSEYTENEGERMQRVMRFTLDNFRKTIRLEEVANVASMTKNAFCKYFKKRTNKTYFTFLSELRIEEAASLLIRAPEKSIFAISEEVGYSNLSNFNRQFKSIKQRTPREYRELLIKSLP